MHDSRQDPTDRRQPGRTLSALAVGPAALTTPFLSFLQHHGYSATSAEALVVLAILAISGLVLSIGLLIGGRFWTGISLGLIVGLWAEVQFPDRVDDPVALSGVCLVAGLLTALLHRQAARILATTFGVLWLTTVLIPGSPLTATASTAPRGDRATVAPPILVHLVLDAHIGIEGLPAADPEGRALGEELHRFYSERGFLVYGRAYSEFFDTSRSLSTLFNFSRADELANERADDLVSDAEKPFESRLVSNQYFAGLRRRGYRLSVDQSNYLDLCSSDQTPVEQCRTHLLWSLDFLSDQDWPAGAKARALGGAFSRLSLAHKGARAAYRDLHQLLLGFGLGLPPWNFVTGDLPRVQVTQTLDRLPETIARAQRGDAYFAHILLPHAPYVWDRDCNLLAPARWLDRRDRMAPSRTINTPAGRALRYRAYMEQMRCLYRKLDAVLAAIDSNPAAHDAVVLLHGDHGSRLGIRNPTLNNADKLVLDDYVDGFSTLFAVRSPAIEPGYTRQQVPIREIFTQLAGSDFARRPSIQIAQPSVQFTRKGSPLLSREVMPAFGWDAAPE